MFLARQENGSLYLFGSKPVFNKECRMWIGEFMCSANCSYPEVIPENDPIKIGITSKIQTKHFLEENRKDVATLQLDNKNISTFQYPELADEMIHSPLAQSAFRCLYRNFLHQNGDYIITKHQVKVQTGIGINTITKTIIALKRTGLIDCCEKTNEFLIHVNLKFFKNAIIAFSKINNENKRRDFSTNLLNGTINHNMLNHKNQE